MIDIKYIKSKHLSNLKYHNFGRREKIKDRLVELLDEFIDVYDKEIRVICGCDPLHYEPDTVHGRGEAVHIITSLHPLEAFYKALAFRGKHTHGPNFFTGIGCCINTWKIKNTIYSGLHLDVRPLWFEPDSHIEKSYPQWMNQQGVQIWGCIPNPEKEDFVKKYYPCWKHFPLINNRLYVPVDYRFISFVNQFDIAVGT